MSTYTTDKYPTEIHFLNDGCIESCLTSRSNDRVNPIPSYDAVSAAYGEFISLSAEYGTKIGDTYSRLTSFESETTANIYYLSNTISTVVSNDITTLRDDMTIQQTSAIWLSGLINALSTYDSTLSTALNAGYAKYDTLSVAYGNDRLLSVIIKNGNDDQCVTTVNTDDFLLNRIFSSIEISGTQLLFKWNSGNQEYKYIPVDLTALTQIYHGKDGISVVQCVEQSTPHAFDIIPDYDKVASTGSVNALSDTVKDLSGIVIAMDRTNPKLIKFAAEISHNNNATYLSDYVVNIENFETKIPAGSLVYVKTDISTADPLELEEGDYLLFHTHDGQPYVDLADPIAVGQNLFIIRSNATTKAINSNFVWLSGGNTAEHAHMISGMNEISVLSVGTMSAYAAEIESLTATNIASNTLSTNSISVDNAIISTLSADNLTVDFSKLTDGTSSVANISTQITRDANLAHEQLSDAISSKIWFKSYTVNELSGVNGDLSVIKITGTDYDEILSDPDLSSTISESAVYIIDRDYIEGYGRQLCNIVMDPTVDSVLCIPDIATTKKYVDDTIDQTSSTLTGIISSISSDLSDAISSKVFIKSYSDAELSDGVNCDLSVIKMPGTDYDEILSDPELSSTISESAVYIIDRDYIEGYGRQLCNIVMDPNGDESLSTPDVAATKKYVDDTKDQLLDHLSNLLSAERELSEPLKYSDYQYMLSTIWTKLGGTIKPEIKPETI